MEDVETRELRYFVAVAEELHFGRAAERLGIAQPPLSRAIRRLEHRLGVELLERTSHGSRLTPAGEVLLAEGRTALDAVAAAARRAQRTGPKACLVLAMKPGGDAGLLPAILRAYEKRPDALPVEFAFSLGDRAAMLRDGRADVGLLHHPQNDLSGLATEELAVERRVVALADGHPLAARDELRMDDLAGEELPQFPEAARPVAGPRVGDVGELMQLVALGRAIALVTESAAQRPHRGVVYRPVLDAVPATLVLAWVESSRSRAVAAFVTAASGVSMNVDRV
ncbi:LysR family transcriptional regulator [Actinoplanes sp. NPDC000266]